MSQYVSTALNVAYAAMRLLENLESSLQERARSGSTESLIFFSVFLREYVTEDDVENFVSDVVSKFTCEEAGPEFNREERLLCIGKTKFRMLSWSTRIADLLLGESLFREMVSVLEDSDEDVEYSLEDVLEEFGESDLSKITDFTIMINPVNPKPGDVGEFIRRLYDMTYSGFEVSQISVKIVVYAPEKRLSNIGRYLVKHFGAQLQMYLGENKLTVILKPSQVIDPRIYEIIYKLLTHRRILSVLALQLT